MSYVIMGGMLFWIAIAFFGSRHVYLEESGPLYGFFKKIKSSSPLFLTLGSIILLLVAIVFCNLELSAIQNREGVIGFKFMLSVLFGIAGACGLSASLFLKN